jgi:hypothetical protein
MVAAGKLCDGQARRSAGRPGSALPMRRFSRFAAFRRFASFHRFGFFRRLGFTHCSKPRQGHKAELNSLVSIDYGP